MIPKKNFIIFSLTASFFLHFFPLYFFTLDIEARKSPLIYSWLDILYKEELFPTQKKPFLKEFAFSVGDVRKGYFIFPPFSGEYSSLLKESTFYPSFSLANYFTDAIDYLYLWKKTVIFSKRNEEVIPYQLFVSPYGKVLFSYPCKLPFNSVESIACQEYIHQASLFLKDKFFWTKLDGVVK